MTKLALKPHPLDALAGKTVRALWGKRAGRVGIVVSVYPATFATPARISVRWTDSLEGWPVSSLSPDDVEVVGA